MEWYPFECIGYNFGNLVAILVFFFFFFFFLLVGWAVFWGLFWCWGDVLKVDSRKKEKSGVGGSNFAYNRAKEYLV